MRKSKKNLKLNTFLVKDEYNTFKFIDFLKPGNEIRQYQLDKHNELNGELFVKISQEKKTEWSTFAETLTGTPLNELTNKSSSAVLFVKNQDTIIAFTFGYGRYLIDTDYFVQDFGIKTALNTLKHNSLRSVELYTFDDQAIQKKSQASRESGISVFGIDILKDVLRAVTGSPKDGVIFNNISGGDAVYSFNLEMDIIDIPDIITKLTTYYNQESYKKEFSWVDNIRKIKEKKLINSLDDKLIENIQIKSTKIMITIPEILQWDLIEGFSFTGAKTTIKPTFDTQEYFNRIDVSSVNVDSIKRDRIYIFDINNNEWDYQIYKCLYFEYKEKDKTYILFSGLWYEINTSFIKRINQVLKEIKVSNLSFPPIKVWKEDTKLKTEREDDYNKRVSEELGYHLLDKRLIKSDKATTAIELCDLLTNNKQFIHVKHRKSSSDLSHLFAQGRVSAELLLSDIEFRRKTRSILKKVAPCLEETISLDKFKSDEVEIIFLILGEDSTTLKDNLPFFSKVNLSQTYESLTQRRFKVTIAGAGKKTITIN